MTVRATKASTPITVPNITGRTYKAQLVKDGAIITGTRDYVQGRIDTHKSAGGEVHRGLYGSIGTPGQAAERRLSGNEVAGLTVSGLEKRYQAAGLSKKDQELVDKLLPATNQSWFDKAASLFGKQLKVVVEPQAFRELSSNYTKKQELLKQRNIREEAIQNEQKYLSDLHKTVMHQITNLKDNTSSFTDGFYKDNGQRHEGKDLQVHLPSAADKRAEVLKHANQANNLQIKLQEAKRELSTMDVNNPDPAAKVIRERKEREVADLGTNIKVAQNTVMDLLKAGNNE